MVLQIIYKKCISYTPLCMVLHKCLISAISTAIRADIYKVLYLSPIRQGKSVFMNVFVLGPCVLYFRKYLLHLSLGHYLCL